MSAHSPSLRGIGGSELFIRNGDGILLVYSITSRISFEKIHTFHKRVLEVKDQDWFPIILVGDDCHLEHERQVGTNGAFTRKSPRSPPLTCDYTTEGRDLAKHFACPFIETSSKHGINVDNAFYSIVREIRKYKKNQPETPSGLVDIQASLMPPMPRPQARWRRLLSHLLPFSNTK
jgi:GTPase KRas protein